MNSSETIFVQVLANWALTFKTFSKKLQVWSKTCLVCTILISPVQTLIPFFIAVLLKIFQNYNKSGKNKVETNNGVWSCWIKNNFHIFFFFHGRISSSSKSRMELKIEFLFVTISQLRLKRKKRITPQGLFFKTKITTFLLTHSTKNKN